MSRRNLKRFHKAGVAAARVQGGEDRKQKSIRRTWVGVCMPMARHCDDRATSVDVKNGLHKMNANNDTNKMKRSRCMAMGEMCAHM